MLHRGARPLVCILALLSVPLLPLSAQLSALNSDAGWIPPALTPQGQAAANPDGIAVDALAMLQRGEANGDPAPIREMFRLATMATSRQKQSAWGPFLSARGLLALVRMDAPPMLSDAQREGEGYVEAFWRHLLMALERDPSFAPARELAATQLVAAGDRYLTADQQRLVERMVSAPAATADFHLVHARDLRTKGDHDRALAAFDRAAALGGDAEQARRGIARLRPRRDRADLDEAETESEQRIHMRAVLVETGGQSDRIGKAQAQGRRRQCRRRAHQKTLQSGRVHAIEPPQRTVVRAFGIHRHQQWAGEGVHRFVRCRT